jgi:hypothetical protein
VLAWSFAWKEFGSALFWKCQLCMGCMGSVLLATALGAVSFWQENRVQQFCAACQA